MYWSLDSNLLQPVHLCCVGSRAWRNFCCWPCWWEFVCLWQSEPLMLMVFGLHWVYFELINFLFYIQSKDGNTDWAFPTIKDQSQLLISHAKSSKVSQATWYLLLRNCIDIAMYIVYFNMGISKLSVLVLYYGMNQCLDFLKHSTGFSSSLACTDIHLP